MKKIVVQTENCIGCGACVGIDSEHFDFNEDGLSHVISQENLDSLKIQDAIAACPVEIISIQEVNDNVVPITQHCAHCSNDCQCDEKAA